MLGMRPHLEPQSVLYLSEGTDDGVCHVLFNSWQKETVQQMLTQSHFISSLRKGETGEESVELFLGTGVFKIHAPVHSNSIWIGEILSTNKQCVSILIFNLQTLETR